MPPAAQPKEKKSSPISTFYLVLYNLVATAAWAYVMYITAVYVLTHKSPLGLLTVLDQPLKLAQTLAVMEIVHSIIGLVRSPFMTTTMQVFSRLFVVWFTLHLEQQTAFAVRTKKMAFARARAVLCDCLRVMFMNSRRSYCYLLLC